MGRHEPMRTFAKKASAYTDATDYKSSAYYDATDFKLWVGMSRCVILSIKKHRLTPTLLTLNHRLITTQLTLKSIGLHRR